MMRSTPPMTPLMPRPRVVFFDYGDTLARTDPPYFHCIAQAFRAAGFAVTDGAVERAGHDATYDWYLEWRAGRVAADDTALPVFVQLLLQRLGVGELATGERTALYEHFARVSATRTLRLFPGTRDLLVDLRGRGYRLGIISNNDGTCAAKCAELGIDEFFDVIVDSHAEGHSKPGTEIFRRACTYMDVAAGDAVHVGDMFGADVCGADDAGLRTIWMNFRALPAPDGRRPTAEVQAIAYVAGCLP